MNHLLLLACLLLGTVLASLPLSVLNLSGLEVRRHCKGPMFAGAPFLVGIEVSSTSRFLPAALVRVESRLSPPRGRSDFGRCFSFPRQSSFSSFS